MTEKQPACNPFDYLLDAFWASLPEETADNLATFKKDVLKGIRSTVDRLVDEELNWTDQRLENARRMREQYRQRPAAATPPNPS